MGIERKGKERKQGNIYSGRPPTTPTRGKREKKVSTKIIFLSHRGMFKPLILNWNLPGFSDVNVVTTSNGKKCFFLVT